ncbi:MAG TPA: type II toxin-antitoxin system RelE/ParE family toxin [Trichococcus flocculiformis]|nr:type II toxin-antitoxin system RelE/ParE family toxin [Trichococcus flocculiformis]
MKKYNFDVYEKENGEAPFLVYLDSLDVKSRAKVLRAITIVEDFGAQSPPGYIDHLGDGIYEFSSNIFRCLYFHFHNNKYIITHGFTKKTQKTPSREITKSKEYRKDYLERNE